MKAYYFLTILALAGCVSKSNYDEVRLENEKLKSELQKTKIELVQLRTQHDSMLALAKKKEQLRNRTPYIEIGEATQYVKDYYNFYNADVSIRNIRLRRQSNNRFKVSIEECPTKAGCGANSFFWSTIVYNLKVNKDGTYQYTAY